MINLESAKNSFMNYIINFDLKEFNTNLKVEHSFRVMDISNQIARKLNLSQEEISLATLIGLLHDIGRFKQYTDYNTYKDLSSVDHGMLGKQILEKDNFLRSFIKDSIYDNIILKAVYNHNKYKIEDNLSENENLFCNIVRDADKIDIIYEWLNIFIVKYNEQINKGIISQYIYDDILRNKQIRIRKDVETEYLDKLLCVIAFIFDINFKESLQLIQEKNYISKILDSLNFKDEKTAKEMKNIRKIVNNYINQTIKKG